MRAVDTMDDGLSATEVIMGAYAAAKSLQDYIPKLLPLAFPWVLHQWRKAARRPVLWVERSTERLWIRTVEAQPVKELSLAIASDEGGARFEVASSSRAYTRLKVVKTSESEARVSMERFSKKDVLEIACPATVTLEVLSSGCVLLQRAPKRYARLLGSMASFAVAVIVLAVAYMPLNDFLLENIQGQDRGDTALKKLLEGLMIAFGAGTLLMAVLVMVLPTGFAAIHGRRCLTVGAPTVHVSLVKRLVRAILGARRPAPSVQ